MGALVRLVFFRRGKKMMQHVSHDWGIAALSGAGESLRWIERAKTWVVDTLPGLNVDVQAGQLAPHEMAALIQPWVSEANGLVRGRKLHPWLARRRLQPLGFPISALEKHFRENGQPAGTGLACLSGAEDLLFWLGKMAQHPPRDSHYTNYLWNSLEQPLTYTGSQQEIFFIDMVQQTHELHGQSYQALLEVCEGDLDIDSPAAIEAIRLATKNTLVVRDLYRSFFMKGATGERNMALDFFVQFRTFKPPFPVKGTTWTGANAGNVAYQMGLDCLMGTIVDEHMNFINGRLRLLTNEDRCMVVDAQELPSLLDCILERLALSRSDLEAWSDEAVGRYVAQHGPNFQRVIDAYDALVKAAGEMSAIHWSLVKNYVIRAGERLDASGKTTLAVPHKAGLTGTSHGQLQQIMEMRRNHPIISKLFSKAKTT